MAKSILVAEDDEALARMYQLFLEELDYTIHIVQDGEQAIQFLKEQDKPDILLLDLLMPTVSGTEVLEYMKENNISIPTIIMTNLSMEKSKQTCVDLGAVDYIVKSGLKLDALEQKIKTILSND